MDAPSRKSTRGRGRGSYGNRPYFFFRRNGRVIPAGGNNDEMQQSFNDRPARGWGSRTLRNIRPRQNGSDMLPPLLSSSFLRPAYYAAPENACNVQSISLDFPVQCPGWCLYFAGDKYETTSDLMRRIKVLEAHFSNNALNYHLEDIQCKGYFELRHNVIIGDENIKKEWPKVVEDLQLHPMRTLATFGLAMHLAVTMAAIDASLSQPSCSRRLYTQRKIRPNKIYARPLNFCNIDRISNISNQHLDNLFCVRGIVSAMGPEETSASWIAYMCSRCRQEQALRQKGNVVSRPYTCKRNDCLAKKGFVELRSSPHTRMKRVQIIRLSEIQLQTLVDFETHLPNTIDIELRHDLVDSVFPAQDIVVTGILKMRALMDGDEKPNSKAKTHSIYMTAISIMSARSVNHTFSERDMEAFAMINGETNCFKLLVNSLAPELYGQELAKAGVLLSLFSGSGSQLSDENEINVLLVGDPGIGKMKLLQSSVQVSSRSAFISGKKGVISATQLNPTLQGRTNFSIDAGALLTANHGHCALDDINRLSAQQDSMLQVMQSQNISLPFAAVYAIIDAPTSIIASADSLHGHYDHSKLLTENIRISPSLLREFHLVFVLVDKPDKNMDLCLTEHIRALHAGNKKSSTIAARFAMKPKTNNSMNMTMQDEDDINDDENYNLLERLKIMEEELDLLPTILIKKFIAFARQQVKPLLNEEAAESLKMFFMDLIKKKDDESSAPVTTSQLEGLIRLTQARARVDLSNEATKAHVRDVLAIVRHSMEETAAGDCVNLNPATASGTSGRTGNVKKFIKLVQMRSSAISRRIFEFDELKEMAKQAGISNGITEIIDVVNMQGFLLKKGPNMYEWLAD